MNLPFSTDSPEYKLIQSFNSDTVWLIDHLFGFDSDFENYLLRSFDKLDQPIKIYTEYILDESVKRKYPNLDIKFNAKAMIQGNNLLAVERYAKLAAQNSPSSAKVNFLSSFNKTAHPGRIWLVLWLYDLGWFNDEYCSKYFEIVYTPREDLVWSPIPDEVLYLYSKYIGNDYNLFLKSHARNQFLKKIIKFGNQHHTTASDDVKILAKLNQKSFVNLVAETAPTNSIPFPTEKSLYPIVHKTLWVAYASLGHHKFMFEKFGFRPYQCFDYAFDQEPDPVERLGKLTLMLTKFSKMTPDQWQDIYNQEKETIQFNFEHVASGSFLTLIQQLNQI
tara:strand:+ start:604 stop:1605 length:1002 start_codon:yes stop_codon:yes gene_type:complete